MKLNKLETVVIVLTSVIILGTFVATKTVAEQSDGTPNSGTDSILKETYNTLVGLSYGSEEGSNGILWNRIISSSTWIPDGTVQVSDVRDGITFYDDSREVKTGTLDFPLYRDMSLQVKDFRDSNASTTWSIWTKTNVSPEVWKDGRTGLYWSPKQTTSTNQFNISICDFYTTTPRGSYDGTDADCGIAINTCGTLSLDANGDSTPETDWYLPTQAELMQAYLNGIYLGTTTSWTTGDYFWSSTEYQSVSTNAWFTGLYHGYTDSNTKTTTYSVRCVHRDL